MNNKSINIIDLIQNYESGVVIKDKKPQHIINYSEDDEPGNGFTGNDDELEKQAIGLFDVPYGSIDENVTHRRRDKYEQQDKEVAERFFGAESNFESEEASPPANINRIEKETINNLNKNELKNFFNFLLSSESTLKESNNLGEKMNKETTLIKNLATALQKQGFEERSQQVLELIKQAEQAPKWANFSVPVERNYLIMVKEAARTLATMNSTLKEGTKVAFVMLTNEGKDPAKHFTNPNNWDLSNRKRNGKQQFILNVNTEGETGDARPIVYADDLNPMIAALKGNQAFMRAGAEMARYTRELSEEGSQDTVDVKYIIPKEFMAGQIPGFNGSVKSR